MKEEPEDKIKCSYCGSDKVRRIVYGLRQFTSIEEQEEFTKTHCLGGCIHGQETHHCDNCYKDFKVKKTE